MSLSSRWINMAEISGGKRPVYQVNYDRWKEWKICDAFGGQWELQSLFKAAKRYCDLCFGHTLEVNYITLQCCKGKYPVYIIVYLSYEIRSQTVYEYCTQAKSSSFTHSESWICWWCIMQIKLFIPTTVVSYTCHPQPLRQGLIKTLNVGSFPLREVMRAEHATFYMYSSASIHTEACPLRQLHGFDSMEWEGPSLPRVWYNESELTAHDLRLSQIRYLKQLEPETVQQTALIHLYTCSLSLSQLYRGSGVMCFNVW